MWESRKRKLFQLSSLWGKKKKLPCQTDESGKKNLIGTEMDFTPARKKECKPQNIYEVEGSWKKHTCSIEKKPQN